MILDNPNSEDGDLSEACPNCAAKFANHSTADLYRCAMNEIHGIKIGGMGQ